jgi:hypothetical protein
MKKSFVGTVFIASAAADPTRLAKLSTAEHCTGDEGLPRTL